MRGLIQRALWPNVKEPSPAAKAILEPDFGNYIPFQIPDEYLSQLAPHLVYDDGPTDNTTTSSSLAPTSNSTFGKLSRRNEY